MSSKENLRFATLRWFAVVSKLLIHKEATLLCIPIVQK